MWQQIEFSLKEHKRGFHLVTGEIIGKLPTLPKVGLLNLFIKHTSCALSINENADPDVRIDMESIFNRLIKEGDPIMSIHWKDWMICQLMLNVAS